MAVVINDFEVVTEAPPANRSAETSAGEHAMPSEVCSPHDMEQALRQQLERLARVTAH